jgi:hypothetical protein
MRSTSRLRASFRSFLVACVVTAMPVAAPDARILRNDSAEPGSEIGFYPRLQGGQHFASILEVPEDLPNYRVCSVVVWIGPNDFNVFTVDIFGVDADDMLTSDIYRSDLDAFQVFGSQNALNEIDLRDRRLTSNERRILLRLTHAEGFDAPPTIAFDGDGIVPRHNRISALLRDGSYLNDYTENLIEDDPLTPRPPGDWVLRLLVVGEDEICPDMGAVSPDGGVIVMPPDEGPPPPPPADGSPKPDREGRDDAGLPVDAALAEDARPAADDAAPDEEMFVEGGLRLSRITPDHGAAGANTAVLIDGRGFPDDGDVEVYIGPERALEVVVEGERTLSAIVPSTLGPGVYDVEVVRGDGESDQLPDAFTVTGEAPAALELSGILPNSIVEDTLPTLTLLGRGFTDDVEFFVGPVMLQGVDLVSPARATAVLSTPLPPGVYPVSARLGDTRADLAAGLTVLAKSRSPRADGCGCRTLGGDAWSAAPHLLIVPLGVWRRRRRTR